MEFKDPNNKVFHAFVKEYFNSNKTLFFWKEFIKNKDIGIEDVTVIDRCYKITNKKKWVLAKIKYGI